MDEWIKDVIIDKAFSLRETLGALKGKDHYSNAPLKIIDTLIEVVEEVINYYEELSAYDTDDITFIRLSLYLSQLHTLIEEIKTVETSDVPVELLPFLEQIMKKYDSDSMIYLRPTKEYNYTHINLLGYIINSAYNNLSYECKDNKKISRICFPLTEKNNAMLHCIFSHEIGHYFNEEFSILGQMISNIKIDKNILAVIIERQRKQYIETKKVINGTTISLDMFFEIEPIKARYTEEYTKTLENWLRELIADAIGAIIIGPAFLFSLIELASSSSKYDDYSPSHPPLFLRVYIIQQILDTHGYTRIFEKYPKIRSKIDELRSTSSLLLDRDETDLESRLLKSSIKPTLPKLIEKCKLSIKPMYDLYEVDKEIVELIKSIKNLIPPNEIIIREEERTYPANPVAILNASWIVKLEYIDHLYDLMNAKTNEEKFKTRVILNEHTLKALELTEIHKKLLGGIKRVSS